MTTIKGKTYEFMQKHIFSPGMLTMRDISVYADEIGTKTITVKFTEFMPEIPARAMNMLKASIAMKEVVNRLVFAVVANKETWKYPTEGAYWTEDMNTAMFLANELAKQVGGAWIIESDDDRFYVWSQGYYHYIGA